MTAFINYEWPGNVPPELTQKKKAAPPGDPLNIRSQERELKQHNLTLWASGGVTLATRRFDANHSVRYQDRGDRRNAPVC
jgi:hypothetical protein